MAEVKLSTIVGTGGIPIKATQRFVSDAPDDITISGSRYLRLGVIETDTSLFDTTIWSTKGLTPEGDSVDISGVGIGNVAPNCSIQHSGDTMVCGFVGTGMRSSDGLAWEEVSTMIGGKTPMYEVTTGTNAGRLVYGDATDSGAFIRYSDDLFTTTNSSQVTGLSGAIDQIIVGGGRVVAIITGAYKYTTDDTWTSWSDCTGDSVTLSGGTNQAAYGNGKWVTSGSSGANSVSVNTSSDGIAWTRYLNVFDTSSHASGALFFDGYANVFRKIAEITTNVFNMWTSSDGITWIDEGTVVYDNESISYTDIGYNFQVNPTTGLITSSNSISGGFLLQSRDGGKRWSPVGSTGGTLGGVAFGEDLVTWDDAQTQKYSYDLYAGQIEHPVEGLDAWQKEQNRLTYVRIT